MADLGEVATWLEAEVADVTRIFGSERDSRGRELRERDELLDALKRTQADFENYKKRIERQSAELRDRANERMVEALLPALDAFSLARAHLGDVRSDARSQGAPSGGVAVRGRASEGGPQRESTPKGAAFDPSRTTRSSTSRRTTPSQARSPAGRHLAGPS